jgi:hypothetical protein
MNDIQIDNIGSLETIETMSIPNNECEPGEIKND